MMTETDGWPAVMSGPDYEQLGRQMRFEQAHPEVTIKRIGFGSWEADISPSEGERYVYGHSLQELMDRLDGIFDPP